MNVLILHGIGGEYGIHWQQWLRDELIKAGHKVVMPTLSEKYHPDGQTWLKEIHKEGHLNTDAGYTTFPKIITIITALDKHVS